MKLQLNNRALIPPPPRDGFKYRDGREAQRLGQWWLYVEQTDTWLFAGDYRGLVENYREHLLTNKVAVPADIEGTVEELICSMTPHKWKNGCIFTDAQGFSLTVTYRLVKRWVKTMAALVKDGTLVSQEEAEARAQTCLNCRFRAPITGCKGCGQSLGGMITTLLIDRSTSYDDQLTACGVCGCAQKAMIHIGNETLDAGSGGLEYPENIGNGQACWRRQ